MYTPSPTYLAALNAVADAKLSASAAAAWVVIVVVLVLITIEVPILLYVLAPGWTIPKLRALNRWLDRNGHALLVYVLLILGVWLVSEGLVGTPLARPGSPPSWPPGGSRTDGCSIAEGWVPVAPTLGGQVEEVPYRRQQVDASLPDRPGQPRVPAVAVPHGVIGVPGEDRDGRVRTPSSSSLPRST